MLLHRSKFVPGLSLIAAIALASACGDSTGPLAPFEPQIANTQDDFQFQASGVTNVTWTFNYTWSNTGDSATVNQSTTTTGGSAVLKVFNQAGTVELYSQDLSSNGTFGMTKSVAGNWRIRVIFTNYSGTVNFRVQKQ